MTKDEILSLQQQAEQGDADGQYRLAMMHIYGDSAAVEEAQKELAREG